MSSTAFAADDQVFVTLAAVDSVAKMEAAYALGKEGSCLSAANGNQFPEHTYPGMSHQFQPFPSRVVEREGY